MLKTAQDRILALAKGEVIQYNDYFKFTDNQLKWDEDGTEWLYRRQVYQSISNDLKELRAHSAEPVMHRIVGTGGTGKSLFGLFHMFEVFAAPPAATPSSSSASTTLDRPALVMQSVIRCMIQDVEKEIEFSCLIWRDKDNSIKFLELTAANPFATWPLLLPKTTHIIVDSVSPWNAKVYAERENSGVSELLYISSFKKHVNFSTIVNKGGASQHWNKQEFFEYVSEEDFLTFGYACANKDLRELLEGGDILQRKTETSKRAALSSVATHVTRITSTVSQNISQPPCPSVSSKTAVDDSLQFLYSVFGGSARWLFRSCTAWEVMDSPTLSHVVVIMDYYFSKSTPKMQAVNARLGIFCAKLISTKIETGSRLSLGSMFVRATEPSVQSGPMGSMFSSDFMEFLANELRALHNQTVVDAIEYIVGASGYGHLFENSS